MMQIGKTVIGGVLGLILSVSVAGATEPVYQDCLEGAGDDLKSVSIEDLQFPPSLPAPTS